MATDFWASSHYKRWLVDRWTLTESRITDEAYLEDSRYLKFFSLFFANVIVKLAKKLQLRQRVIATAIVFFRRFYLKNAYCDTDPFIVIAACCYVAAKAEESPVHIKYVVSEARQLFSQDAYGIKNFSSDNSKLAEMEFYLVGELECDLTVFHPYRTLLTLCRKEGNAPDILNAEAGELGIGIDDGQRYWGTGDGQLELQEGALQMAWFIINDTYRSELCLLHPPHLIAIAAIYLTLVLHTPTHTAIQHQRHAHADGAAPTIQRRSSRQASASAAKKPQDALDFLAELNVSLACVAGIAQEIIELYAMWDCYEEDPVADSARSAFGGHAALAVAQQHQHQSASAGVAGSPHSAPTQGSKDTGGSGSAGDFSSSGSSADDDDSVLWTDTPGGVPVTPARMMQELLRMRADRMGELANLLGIEIN